MAAFFIIGEKKIRPDIYYRYENWGNPPLAGADDGKCAAVFASNWGPLGTPSPMEKSEDIARIYGDGGKDGTTAVPMEQFKGGARRVFGLRLGSGGTPGKYQIKDTADTAVIDLTLLHPGSKKFSVTIRPTLADPNKTELIILDDTTEMEKLTFDTPAEIDQVSALMNAWALKKSNFFTLTKLADGVKSLGSVTQTAITPGTDPVVNIAAYSAAFEALEAFRWNVLAVDTNDTAVHMLAQTYLNRVYNGGKFVMGAVGEPSVGEDAVDFDTRLTHASAYNDYQMIYVGNGYIDTTGNVMDGWLAAARISGMIAGKPSNESITRGGGAVTGAAELTELLSNYDYERAISAGMLTFSKSAADTVWVESGINTLVLPGSKDDEGWKKIKRVKVRFELFQRLNDTIEPLVGRINNDSDGRMTIIQLGNGVCNSMVAEKKLLAGAHLENDPDNPPQGDSAWFLVYADDIDAFEKGYFAFKFRFAPDENA